MEKNIRTRGITLVFFFIRYKMPQILIYERRNVGIGRQGRLGSVMDSSALIGNFSVEPT